MTKCLTQNDETGPLKLSETAYHYIAGISKHARGFTAVTNSLVNSYKRLVPGCEVPVYVAWSASNRSAMIRIPASRGLGTRTEVRCPDPTCNPYLAFAMIEPVPFKANALSVRDSRIK